ncbi:VOC family protein [Jiangella muralis]|uniref:VOC family protein n=1 Tax=Jiangella muralis TaxID=702383 RepID=UPI00069FA0AB|nr:VOC family protein [Jiangella muralis]
MDVDVDHLVWAGPDLDRLVEHVTVETGATPVYGGRHEGRGTHNHLVGLGPGRYLELLGPDPGQPEPSRPRPMRVDGLTGPALVGWAVRTDDIDGCVAAARDRGYDPGDVAEMSRRTSDGTLLTWRLTPPEGGFDGVVPFVIDWLDSPHPASGLSSSMTLGGLTLRHPEPDRVSAALTALGLDGLAEVVHDPAPGISAVLTTPRGDVLIG